MNNNVLRRIRYILDCNDQKIVEIFQLAGVEVSKESVVKWLKRDDDEEFAECKDKELAAFLNGLIIEKRGKKDGELPKIESSLTNNIILRKLMIAFSLKSDDVLDILDLVNFKLGKHELSALFRKPDHRNYKKCKDQILRNFLNGLQEKLTQK